MPTTSNFGWTTPADTDLVKNGALAIRTLGNGIDATMAELKGGTTGQVLSKTSNTDMDFTWVTTDDANAIQNAIVDAKGDLIAATANDTPARLAVGNNGETLVADSSTSTGLRWQSPVQGNPVLNSAFQIWQRGTSFAFNNNNTYTADRWFAAVANTGATISRQLTNDTTNLPFIQYCARLARNSGVTNTGAIVFQQSFETINSIPFAGRTVTLSFYARAGANFSASNSRIDVFLVTGTGTDQNQSVGYTGQATPISSTATLTTTWQRFTYTGTLATTATEIATAFTFTPSGTAGANDWYEITGLQLEVGSVATPFKTQGVTLAGELAACQRYYYRINFDGTASYGPMGMAYSTTNVMANIPLKQTMRVAPTAVDYASLRIQDAVNAATTVTAVALDQCAPNSVAVYLTASSLTQYRPYFIYSNTLASFIGFTAEL